MLKLFQWFLRYDHVLYPLFLSLFLYGALSLFAHFYGDAVFSAFLVGVLVSLALFGVALSALFLATHSIAWLRDIAAEARAQEASASEGEAEAPLSASPETEEEIAFTSDPDKPIDA